MKLFNNSELDIPPQEKLQKLVEQGEKDLAILRRLLKFRLALDEGREPEPEPPEASIKK